MNKQKIVLPTGKWGTLKTKYKPESNDVKNDEFTAGSENFITNNTGAIEKRPTDVLYNSDTFTNPPKDQFEAVFSTGVHHLLVLDGGALKYSTGSRTFSTAASGFTPAASMEYSMYQNRVYMDNGIDNPSVYDLTPSYGGVTYAVPQVKTMGAIPPSSAVTFGADTSGGSVPVGGHTYVVTFLYYGLEESNGGPVSTLHTVASPNQTVHLTAVPVGGYGVTARKIYRDNGTGNYLLISTISDNVTTTYTDTTSAGSTPIPVANDLPPIFSYIALNLSRQFVAGVPGSPSVLFWSLADFPDIFDPDNALICNPKDPINGVYTFQGSIVVLNRHSFGKILGNTDDTFEYEEVSGSVGCVDNRSIQIRTIDGVPVLVWLSDRGFYKFDGSSVTYISDPIEDIVNFNLQQVSFTTGSNNQSTEADYAGGTLSPSIDIASDPGVITVLNPEMTYQAEADWEGGSSLINVVTADGSNQLKVPTAFTPTLAAGSIGGAAVVNTVSGPLAVSLTTVGDQNIPQPNPDGNFMELKTASNLNLTGIAQKFVMQFNGTVPHITFYYGYTNTSATVTWRFRVYADSLGSPGTILYTTTGSYVDNLSPGSTGSATVAPNVAVAAGTSYWFSYEITGGSNNSMPTNFAANYTTQLTDFKCLNGGVWQYPSAVGTTASIIFGSKIGSYATQMPCIVFFTQTPIASSGTWNSPVYDSASVSGAIAASVFLSYAQYASFYGATSITMFVDYSNDATMSTGVTTTSYSNPSGTVSTPISGQRYWRIRYSLSTPDNRETPYIASPLLKFNTTGTWVSQAIDCTTDVTSYDALTITQNVPAGTSVTITVATSADNITYSSFGPIGSAVVQRYIKVQAVLVAITADTSTPSISFLRASWQQTSTFTSSIIDLGQVPTGWSVFQAAVANNGGSTSIFMRSAASSGAISSATFFPVTNGTYPPTGVVPLEFTQWKIVFTSSMSALPVVSGVTVNWFIGSAQSPIRAASLFFNKTYYLSAATIGSLTNNVVLVWDFENNWRVFTDITMSAIGLFFNEPFYCDATRGNVYQWLISPSGSGSAINMDVRTKAFDLDDVNTLKIPRSLRVTGINTGTTIHAYFSLDRGATWVEMLNVDGGLGYVTSAAGSRFSQYFVIDVEDNTIVSATTLIFRVTSVDALPCTIMELEPVIYSRKGKYLEVPI